MAKLTTDQLAFLRAQKIPLSSLFDVSGMKKDAYREAMKADGKMFAYGANPCTKGGHTLKSRVGRCVQCETASISFMMRNETLGYVYIAASLAGKLIKVGSTNDVEGRLRKINYSKYGGQTDWQLLSKIKNDKAGRLEGDAQSRLAPFAAVGEYTHEGRIQQCYELFRCNFEDARDAINAALGSEAKLQTDNEERALLWFKFRP